MVIPPGKNAQLQIPRSAFLRCPRCKNSDAYTPGEKCLHCGYMETSALLIKRASEFRYRIIPLITARDFSAALKTRSYTGSRKKYDPIAGALLEYEYATIQNMFRTKIISRDARW